MTPEEVARQFREVERDNARRNLVRVSAEGLAVYGIYAESNEWPVEINGERITFEDAKDAIEQLRDDHEANVRNALASYAYYLKRALVIDDGPRKLDPAAGPATGADPAGAQDVDANGAPVDVVAPPVVLEPPDAAPREPVVGWKDTNPKAAFGDKKVPFSTVPAPVIAELGLAMLEGALKYGRHNYRVSGVRASTYYDAAMRHLTAWWEGEDIDPDSGLPHPVKAMACLAVLRDATYMNMLNDDRPPPVEAQWQGILNAAAKRLVEKYPNPKPPHTRKPQP